MIQNGTKAKTIKLDQGVHETVWVGEPTVSKPAKFGDFLVGKVSLLKDVKFTNGELYNVVYPVPPEGKPRDKFKSGTVGPDVPIPKKSDPQLLSESVRDVEIGFLSKFTDDIEVDALLTRLESTYPSHIPLFTQKLRVLLKRFSKTVCLC